MSGVERIPLRVPEEWDPKWFRDFVRDVLGPADARNAVGSFGVQISGEPRAPAAVDLQLQGSLTADALGIRLDGDHAAPGGMTYYGTDSGGAKGFHSLPAAGIGDVSGPASAVDGEIALFSGTTGKALKRAGTTGLLKAASGVLAASVAGTDHVAPGAVTGSGLTMATARLLGRSTASTGAIEEVSVGANLSLSGGQLSAAAAAPAWLMQTADYTLTSTTSAQQIFNQVANGRLTLGTGVYEFALFLYMTGMSATAGNAALDILGAGTAVCDRWGWSESGMDAGAPLGQSLYLTQSAVSNSVAYMASSTGTGTGLAAKAAGMFRVSTAGTLIPSLALTTAAAAVVKAGSWFRITKVGESANSYVGAWD